MMRWVVGLAVLASPPLVPVTVAAQATPPAECADAPSRASDAYWLFVETCGCESLTPPSRASLDYERYMRACAAWRRANPRVDVIVAPAPSSEPAAVPEPAVPDLAVAEPTASRTAEPSARPRPSAPGSTPQTRIGADRGAQRGQVDDDCLRADPSTAHFPSAPERNACSPTSRSVQFGVK